MFNAEVSKLIKRREYKIAVLIFAFAVLFDILLLCYDNYGSNMSELLPAYYMTVFFNESKAPFRLVFGIFLPICSAYVASDTYLNDLKTGFNNMILVRVNRKSYIKNKAYAIFFVVFVTLLLILCLDLILAISAFPLYGGLSYESMPWLLVDTGLYKSEILNYNLYAFHPYIWIIVKIIIRSLTGGIMAVFAYSTSFFIKNRYFCLLSPFLLINITDGVMEILYEFIGASNMPRPFATLFVILPYNTDWYIYIIPHIVMLFITCIFIKKAEALEDIKG